MSESAKFSVKSKYMAIAGMMAALITIMTAYVGHIPIGGNGGYLHFGDALIYLAASILPTPYALVAAAIGGGLADLLTAPLWAPATIVIKILISLSFTSKKQNILNVRNIVATLIALPITVGGYFLAEMLIFGSAATAVLAGVPGNLIQGVGSAVIFVLIAFAFDKTHLKKRLL